jgi:hypothetical protein
MSFNDSNIVLFITYSAECVALLSILYQSYRRRWLWRKDSSPHPFRKEEHILMLVALALFIDIMFGFGLTLPIGVYQRAGDSVYVQIARPISDAIINSAFALYFSSFIFDTWPLKALATLSITAVYTALAFAVSVLHVTDPDSPSIQRQRYDWLFPYFFAVGFFCLHAFIVWTNRLNGTSFKEMQSYVHDTDIDIGDANILMRTQVFTVMIFHLGQITSIIFYGLIPETGHALKNVTGENVFFAFRNFFFYAVFAAMISWGVISQISVWSYGANTHAPQKRASRSTKGRTMAGYEPVAKHASNNLSIDS